MDLQRFSYDDLDVRDVQAVDPLCADAVCRALPRMNERADLGAIVSSLRSLLPTRPVLESFSPWECLAAMRDLGIFLGSIKRHGVEPIDALPEIEPILVELGARTQMVPRDTVHHYIVWNPTGDRERTYTNDPMEVSLMSSVRMSLPALGAAVALCRQATDLEVTDPDMPELMSAIADRLKILEATIDLVLERVSPVFFAKVMRPYFEDIFVDGRIYLGPAAAHVPLSLVDLALWSSDHVDERREYELFWRESAEFSLPAWRGYYEEWHKRPSIITRLAAALEGLSGADVPPSLRAVSEAMERVLQTLIVFRGRHLRIAREAYAEDVRLYALGSGGGSIAMLSTVLLLTRENAQLVRRSVGAKARSLAARQASHPEPTSPKEA